jgi:hypothetical protein
LVGRFLNSRWPRRVISSCPPSEPSPFLNQALQGAGSRLRGRVAPDPTLFGKTRYGVEPKVALYKIKEPLRASLILGDEAEPIT